MRNDETVDRPDNSKNIHFIFDTGLLSTYLCDDVLDCFGLHLSNDKEVSFCIGGNLSLIQRSRNAFRDVNLIGADYFNVHIGTVTIDYGKKQGKMIFEP